jgi:acyl-coenzyme A synthetase/AMP-(fatty) acid ligase
MFETSHLSIYAAVKDVIVIPVLDEEAGELPRAYVVKQDNVIAKNLTEKDVVEVRIL